MQAISQRILASLVALGLTVAAWAGPTADEHDDAAREYFTDTVLINQDGEDMRFYSDVLKDQIVVISFIFTNCQGACPLITQKMRVAREQLEEDARDKIRFISISIDPTRDTPEALREFAEKQGALGNWVFLTGEQDNVDNVVKRLGQYFPDVEEHSTLLIAGNVKTRLWLNIPPQANATAVAEKLRDLVAG